MKRNELADIVEQSIAKITDDWIIAVRDHQRITSSDDLSDGGLRDHVPQVLDEIITLLRTNSVPNIHNTREARVSAYTRYSQDYRISELITEIALLRRIIFNYLYASMLKQQTTLDLHEYSSASNIINAYLDEEMRFGSSIFCESIKN